MESYPGGEPPLPEGFTPSAEEVYQAVEAAQGDYDSIAFAGAGEPLLRLGVLEQAAQLLLPKGVPLRVNTNGLVARSEAHAAAHGYGVVREYTGHGIGRAFHEGPRVLHYGAAGTGAGGAGKYGEPLVWGGGSDDECFLARPKLCSLRRLAHPRHLTETAPGCTRLLHLRVSTAG